jgi:anti-sigma factor RsiW
VNCARFTQVLDAHIDGELDHATSGEIAAHLTECAACTALRDQRLALRQALRRNAPYFKAPATLAPAIRRSLAQAIEPASDTPQAIAKPRAPRFGWRLSLSWFQAAAFASIAAFAGLISGYWLAQPQPDYPLRDPAVASHVAALAPTRQLIQVASSDRHTVKPWFQGKVDFAPPVKDLKDDGFVLVGGRLDQIADKPAAAVVYQVRKHVINLFVWRAADRATDAIAASSLRGFSVVTWATDGLRFAAVSDVDPRDLTRFAQLVATP